MRLWFIILTVACGSRGDTGTCDRDPPLTYDNFGQAYLTKHCVGCHGTYLPEELREGAPIGIDLDTYDDALFWAERIQARATGSSPTMPPGGGPSEEERAKLQEWLNCHLIPAAGAAQ